MQINKLVPQTKLAKRKDVGRGGARGKNSGRGTKGQHQHGGHGIRPHIRDEIKRIPKLRGRGVNSNTPVTEKSVVINLTTLEVVYSSGAHVTPETLFKHKLIKKQGDMFPRIKILGSGEFSKKIKVKGCFVSASAKEKIEKAGGTIVA